MKKKESQPRKTPFERIKNIQIFLALLVIIILQIPVAFNQVRGWYNNSLNEYHFKSSKIESLEAGASLNFFKEKLGNSIVSNDVKIGTTDLKEDYFIDRLYHVQTISTLSGTVIYYAVTIRDKDFNPEIVLPDKSAKIILGKSKLKDYKNESFLPIHSNQYEKLNKDGNFNYEMGAHHFNYYERYYLANPGNYETIYLGINESGCLDWNDSFVDKAPWNLTSKDLTKFRKTNLINTYAETVPLVKGLYSFEVDGNDPAVASGGLGVDYNTVRVFNF